MWSPQDQRHQRHCYPSLPAALGSIDYQYVTVLADPDWQPKRPKSKPTVDPVFALQLWERLTGASASEFEAEGLQEPNVQWFKKVCGHCEPCRRAAKRQAQGFVPRKKGIQCTALPKVGSCNACELC